MGDELFSPDSIRVINAILIIIILYMVFGCYKVGEYFIRERKDLKDRRLLIDPKKVKNVKLLTAQTARWTAASQQDQSPVIALMHANYGAAYLEAVNSIATHTEIYNASGVDILHLKEKVLGAQDAALKKVAYACPQFKGDIDPYLIKVGVQRVVL